MPSAKENSAELELEARFKVRITIVKNAREMFNRKQFSMALKGYADYLKVWCFKTKKEDVFDLKVQDIPAETPVTEILLISHVYWELAQIYASDLKHLESMERSLESFVEFSAGQPYQVLNAEMTRKKLKKLTFLKFPNPKFLELLDKTHKQIYIQSKSCYIATECFGSRSYETRYLRELKARYLAKSQLGRFIIKSYYQAAPRLLHYLQLYPSFRPWVRVPIKYGLLILIKTIQTMRSLRAYLI